MYRDPVEFSSLAGKTLTAIEVSQNRDEIVFATSEGEQYRMYHDQDCCESVGIEDIAGDLEDLIGSPILYAEESTSDKDPQGYEREYPPESTTWTFYRIGTIKGTVVLRWLGESNGYYSESVSLVRVDGEEQQESWYE